VEEQLTLALEFLAEHPDAAVRILQQHEVRQVCSFLDHIPESYAVLVLERSLPAFAAHLCRELGSEHAARLLLQQDVSRMVAVLRHLEPGQVEAILHECPKSRRAACQLLLHHSLQSTGAWIVPNTAVVSDNFTVAEVLNFLKDATEETFSKYVFVVNREGVPEGRISYLSLLKARQDQRVGWIMEKPVEVLSANMLLAQVAKLPCWQAGDVMPVVSTQRQFIGVLRHVDLRRGLQQQQQQREEREVQGSDPLTGIFEVYGKSLLALFSTVSNAVESELKS
jgi:Mg/Co/Ni transporter MgtE